MPTRVCWLCKWARRIGGPVVLIYICVAGYLYCFTPIQPLEAYNALEAYYSHVNRDGIEDVPYAHLIANKDKLVIEDDGTKRIYHYGPFKIDPQTNKFEYSQGQLAVGDEFGEFERSFPHRYKCGLTFRAVCVLRHPASSATPTETESSTSP